LSELVLYGVGSPNVRKVVIMLEELGLAYALTHVAVFKGEQFEPWFLALNPLAKVPVLVDPVLGMPLAESGAILVWLAEREASALLPSARPARQEVLQWLMVQMASVGPMFGQLNHFNMLPRDTEAYGRGRFAAQAETLYRLLDARLAAHAFLAGGAYSIADIATYPWALYLEKHGFDPAAFPSLLRWRKEIDARPAVSRADARMGEAFNALSAESRRNATLADLDRFFGRTEKVPPADYSSVIR